MLEIGALLAAALTLPLIAGLYSRKVKARSAILSMLVSVVVTFALELVSKGNGVLGVPSLIVGIAVGTVVMLSISSIENRMSD